MMNLAPHGSLSVVEALVAPGQYIGPHTHSREDEVTYVVEGPIVALLDDTVLEVNAGSFLLKPAGVMHAFGRAQARGVPGELHPVRAGPSPGAEGRGTAAARPLT